MKKIYFFSVFMFCNLNINAQCQIHIDSISYSYYNGVIGQPLIIDNYQITNNSNDEYLTWVSLVPTNNKSNIELIRDFFKQRKGDFSWLEMLYENLLEEQSVSIGYSFIKNITSGETFSYIIVKTNACSIIYQDRIVVISKKEVEQYLKMQIEEKYFFQLSSIVLTEK